jgi:hypothetical protein
MTAEQSRQLKVGDRVCWEKSINDLATTVAPAFAGEERFLEYFTQSSRAHFISRVSEPADQQKTSLG